jgi:hypothetical protein
VSDHLAHLVDTALDPDAEEDFAVRVRCEQRAIVARQTASRAPNMLSLVTRASWASAPESAGISEIKAATLLALDGGAERPARSEQQDG